MRTLLSMSLILVSAVCLAQAPPDSNQKLLDEMKAVRATLDRLVRVMEKNQRAISASFQIQSYNTRLAALQAQHDLLAREERDLSRKVSTLSESVRKAQSGIGASGAPTADSNPDSAYQRDLSERLAAATGLLDEHHARQQAVDREIITLRERISRLERIIGEALAE